jgi:hypothetical protein
MPAGVSVTVRDDLRKGIPPLVASRQRRWVDLFQYETQGVKAVSISQI